MFIRENPVLTSPGFLAGLFLLLFNDFYLKNELSGPIPGKLSDFAGLFAFTLFWIAAFPKAGRQIWVLVASAFLFWKSSYSQPILEIWNELQIGHISRTVDPTDLVALPMVPLAYLYGVRERSEIRVPKWTVTLIALVSIFAFAATSYRTRFDYQNKYHFQGSKTDLFDRIDKLHLTYFDYPLRPEERESGKLELQIPSDICFDSITASVEVNEIDQQTIVSLKELEHRCPKSSGDQERLLREFEREFIERLKTGTPQTKHYKSSS